MTPLDKLFAHVRTAHQNALDSAKLAMNAVTDHDEKYVNATVSELESAAEKMELSARTLRAQIAVFNHTYTEPE